MNSATNKSSKNISIPSDWEIKKLSELSDKVGGGITPAGGERVYKSEGRPFLRSQNIGWGNLLLDDVAFIDEETHKSFQSTAIQEGDVFLNITGASIGRSSVANKYVTGGNVNQHVCIVRTKKDALIPNYLSAFLLSPIGQNLIDSFQAGGNRQGLNFEQIKSFKILLPPLPEQRAIAACLSTWDKAIAKTEALIAQKELQKKWLMQNLLTGRKRLKGCEGEWEEARLGDLGQILSGGTPSTTVEEYWNGDLNWCTPTDITKLYGEIYIGETVRKITELGLKNSSANILPVNSVIVCTRATVGACAINSVPMTTNQGFKSIIPNKINYLFLYYKMLTLKKELISLASGSTFLEVSKGDFEDIYFKVPTIKEQIAIAQVLQVADKDINLLKSKAEKLKEQKRGMIQVLLTGSRRFHV